MEFGTLIDSFRLLIGANPFLFWLFFVGIVVAGLQDLKRKEVDNWLNLFLLVSGLIFIFYRAIFEKDASIVFQAGFALVVMFAIMNLFYYGRVFAGGDAKLLVAMTVFFIGVNFSVTLTNMGIFLLFLMFAGSIYGLVFSFLLYYKNREKVNKEIKKGFDNLWVRYAIMAGIVLFVLSYVDWFFFMFAVFMLVFPVLYVFAKGLENVSMVKEVSGNKLREGDWLVEDVSIGGKIVKSNWDGLSLDDLKLLKKKKKVKIKEGLPFVPAFLIAFLMYVFLKDWFSGFLVSLM